MQRANYSGKKKSTKSKRAACAYVKPLDAAALAEKANASNCAPTWSDLGVAYQQAGDYVKAKEAFHTALGLDADRGATYYNLGNLELEYGFTESAIAQYEIAARKSPTNDNIFLNKGNALRKAGRLAEAETAYKQAIEFNPKNIIATVNLGNLFLDTLRLNDAITLYKSALEIDPLSLPALIGLGNGYCQLRFYKEAETTLKRALKIDPTSAEAHCNLSHLYLAINTPNLALKHARSAIKKRPNFAEALSNLGVAQKDMGDLSGAIESLQQAVKSKEHYTPALANLAIVLKANGQLTEALAAYREAMASAPNDPVPAYNASLILLQLGEFEYGWQLYENRWNAPNFDSAPISTTRPRWQGENTQRRLLIWPEQGIGDIVMFSSLFIQLQNRAPNTIVVIDHRLISLFSRSFPSLKFVPNHVGVSENEFDLHTPIGSLPLMFELGRQTFHNLPYAYLKPDSHKVSYFREKLKRTGKKLCGVSWKSNNKKLGKQRSMELSHLLKLAMSDDVIFINLQYGDTADDLSQIDRASWPFIDLEEIDKTNDIDGLCALIASCDYVVSIDNSTVHFAGALGIPTTVLLPGDRDWRWTEFTNRSLWYPATTYSN